MKPLKIQVGHFENMTLSHHNLPINWDLMYYVNAQLRSKIGRIVLIKNWLNLQIDEDFGVDE